MISQVSLFFKKLTPSLIFNVSSCFCISSLYSINHIRDYHCPTEMRKQRKMGHITIVGSSMGIVEARLNSLLKEDSSDCQSTG